MAEDNLLVREGVRGILAAEPDITVVEACGNADELRAAKAVPLADVAQEPHEGDVIGSLRVADPGDAGVTGDLELRARCLLSYGNGLVVDQLAIRDPDFDAVAAMRLGVRGFCS